MALPTVNHFAAAAATNGALLSLWMPKLQELLFAASWTLEYADADAIGTGSAEEPAWDKTPATNTDAGVAVYKMPANGHTTEWFVRVRPGWAGATTRPHMRGLQIGVTHSSGSVSGGSTEMTPAVATIQSDNRDWVVAASEDGFVLVFGSLATTPAFGIERVRLPDGSVGDDVWGFNKYTSSAAGYAPRHVSAAAGQVSDAPPFALLPHEFGNVGSTIPTAESQDATRVMVLGPYMPGGSSLFAPPRLYVLASPADVVDGSIRLINIDGGDKVYEAFPGSISSSIGIILVATE